MADTGAHDSDEPNLNNSESAEFPDQPELPIPQDISEQPGVANDSDMVPNRIEPRMDASLVANDAPETQDLPPLPKKIVVIEEHEPYTLGNPMQGERVEMETISDDPGPFDQATATNFNTNVTINTNRVEEDEDEDAFMDPNHPLLERIQIAIRDQLTRHTEKLELQVRTRLEESKKQTSRREDLGVELYNAQQSLAKTQALFEGAVENFEIIKSMREESERGLKTVQQEYDKTMNELMNQRKNMEAHQLELEKSSRTLNQLQVYQTQLQSRILVAKRTTLKTEKDILIQEMEKKSQDLLIDSLTMKLRSLQERKATYENQLGVQARETQAARETLQDAQMEMEAIQFEKRQLVNQWRSTLLALQKRDDAVRALEVAMSQNMETLQTLGMELKGYQRTIRSATEQGEELTSILNKLEHEMEYIKRQIATISEQKDKLGDSYSNYIKSLTQTEKEFLVLNEERVSVQAELNQVMKANSQTTQAIQKLEIEMDIRLKSLASVEKEAEGSRKDTVKLRQSIHAKQNQVMQHSNEIANLALEAQNTSQRIESMKETLVTINQELENQNKLVAQYEQQIRLNTDSLSKKASELDALNKKFDIMVSKSGSENMGPLEATIYNLTRSIASKEKECLELQQYWLRAQNELVQMSKRANEVTDEIQTLRMRLTVLNRKKMVVNSAFENEEKEQRELKRTIRHLQNEMVKVNTILSQQHNIYEKLQESNLEMETKFRNKLKDAELDSIQLEANLDQLKKDKEVALQEIVEAEYIIVM
jgi:chromosome segregation ATPase